MSILPVRDALFESVAERTGLPRPFALAAWMAVEEYARGRKGGLSLCGLTADWLAAAIGCGLPEAKSLLAAFVKAGAVVRDPDGGGSRIVRVAKTSKNPGAAIRMARMRARRKAEAEKAKGDQNLSVTTMESYVTPRNVTPPVTPVTPVTQGESQEESTLERNVTRVMTRSLIGDSESGNLPSDSESLPEVLSLRSAPRPTNRQGSAAPDKGKRGTRLPADFAPDIAWAVAHGLPEPVAVVQAEQFRDFWAAKAGQSGCKLDWNAAWRCWARKALDDHKERESRTARSTALMAARCGTAAGPPKSVANSYYLDALAEPAALPKAANGRTGP